MKHSASLLTMSSVLLAFLLSACSNDGAREVQVLPPSSDLSPRFADDSLPPVDSGAVPPVAREELPRGERCDPNYEPCVPIDSDVDCAGGGGNGPSYVPGPVRVVGVIYTASIALATALDARTDARRPRAGLIMTDSLHLC